MSEISEKAIKLIKDLRRDISIDIMFTPEKNAEDDSLKALVDYIAELEAAQRWVMVSERLPNKSGWYLTGLIGLFGGSYTGEVHFDAETGLPWRNSVRDEVYCWLDGVPELPQPPEVQE